MSHVGKPFCGALALAIALPVSAFAQVPESAKDEMIVFTSIELRGEPRFGVHDGKKANIGIMIADGSKRTILTKHDALELDPALSPDGKLIAFVIANKSEVWVMSADGKDRKKLVIGTSRTFALAPTWLPDGKRIAYTKLSDNEDGSGFNSEMVVFDADGKNAKSLGKGLMPAWSPDGKRMVYSRRDEATKEPRLRVRDADGHNDKELVKGLAFAGAWSPDGKRIAYLGSKGGLPQRPHIYVSNADGSGAKPLTTSAEGECPPRWSADGKRLYFTRMLYEPKKSAIRVINADGKNEKELTKGNGLDLLGGSGPFILFETRGFVFLPYGPE